MTYEVEGNTTNVEFVCCAVTTVLRTKKIIIFWFLNGEVFCNVRWRFVCMYVRIYVWRMYLSYLQQDCTLVRCNVRCVVENDNVTFRFWVQSILHKNKTSYLRTYYCGSKFCTFVGTVQYSTVLVHKYFSRLIEIKYK